MRQLLCLTAVSVLLLSSYCSSPPTENSSGGLIGIWKPVSSHQITYDSLGRTISDTIKLLNTVRTLGDTAQLFLGFDDLNYSLYTFGDSAYSTMSFRYSTVNNEIHLEDSILGPAQMYLSESLTFVVSSNHLTIHSVVVVNDTSIHLFGYKKSVITSESERYEGVWPPPSWPTKSDTVMIGSSKKGDKNTGGGLGVWGLRSWY